MTLWSLTVLAGYFHLLDNFARYLHEEMVLGSSFVLLIVILNEINIEVNGQWALTKE